MSQLQKSAIVIDQLYSMSCSILFFLCSVVAYACLIARVDAPSETDLAYTDMYDGSWRPGLSPKPHAPQYCYLHGSPLTWDRPSILYPLHDIELGTNYLCSSRKVFYFFQIEGTQPTVAAIGARGRSITPLVRMLKAIDGSTGRWW